MAKNYSSVILAGLAGFAAGVVVGILFAPEKGSETRKKLKENWDELAEDLKEEFAEELGEIKSALAGVEEEVTQAPVPKKRNPRARKTT